MHVMQQITQFFTKEMHLITITCNAKMMHYTLHTITLKNVIHYNALQLLINITPCLTDRRTDGRKALPYPPDICSLCTTSYSIRLITYEG